jgi:hypothetical protein
MGNAAVNHTKAIMWEELVHLFGEETLTRRIAELVTRLADGTLTLGSVEDDALEVAAKYATGWRPKPIPPRPLCEPGQGRGRRSRYRRID